LGYLIFILEIALITLLILFLGPDGQVFALAYLWPVMMGAWMIGHRATLPLSLLSTVAVAALVLLDRAGVGLGVPVSQAGPSQALVLSLPYLAFTALLIWALTIERERGEADLSERNAELYRANNRLRSLLLASEQLLGRLNMRFLLVSSVLQVRRLSHYERLAIYVREGDGLALSFQVGFPEGFDERYAHLPLPPAWRGASEHGVIESIWEPLSPDDLRVAGLPTLLAGLRHLPLRSPRGVEGMLTLAGDDTADAGENQALQILIHQLGTALENVRLFADLQHERNMLRGILANMAEGVFVVDEGGRVLLANEAATRWLDVQAGAVLRAELAQFCADPAPQAEAAADLLVERRERPLLAYGGRSFSVTMTDLAASEDLPASRIYVAHDVTQEAEAEQMKADFVAYASHEMRTPLTTIKMLVRLLMMDTPEEAKSYEYLTVIRTQLERQTRLVNNLLALARLEAGSYELPIENIRPAAVIAAVDKACRPLAEEKGVRLVLRPGPAELTIPSNAAGLEHVLINLVGNAIKFTDGGGLVEISSAVEAQGLMVAVRDTGIGMTEEQLGHIFTRFYSVHHPNKPGEGTGLGLAISKAITQQLGGDIEVQSRKGRGSTFTVRLPLRAPGTRNSRPDAATRLVCAMAGSGHGEG
jgi:signal transduction histidine kinase